MLRRFLRARVLGPSARSLRRAAVATRAWISPVSNPFLERSLRVEARKHHPLLALMGVALLALGLAAGIYLWWLWWPVLMWPHTPRPSTAPPLYLPSSLGSNLVGFVAILTAGACGYVAFYSTRARAAYLLRQEVVKGTLDSLQLMPLAEERWVWMMSAHPTLLSLLIGAVGLPVYALALWTQQWSLLDILGLSLVFAAIGHVVPLWQPLMWKGAARGNTQQKVDWKALQESLRLARVEANSANLSPAQQLEAQRRTARMMSGIDAVPAAATAGATSAGAATAPHGALAPTAADAASTRKGRAAGVAKNSAAASGVAASGAAGRNRSGCSVWFVMWSGFQFFNAMTRFGGNPLTTLWFNLQQALPSNVKGLFGIGVLLSWPLLLARVLTSPLPFFAVALPPVVLLLPLWIGTVRLRTWGLAAQVSASETFWTMRRAREYKGVVAVLWLLGAVLFAGYAWPSLVLEGALGSVLLGAPPLNSWALAAVWTVALVIGAIAASQLLEAPFTRAASGGLEAPAAWRRASLGVLRALAWAVGLYFVFCWLGFQSGMSRVWLARLVPTTLTVAAFLLADFGTAALQSTLKGGARAAFRTLRWLWSLGLGLEALLRIFVGTVTRSPFQFEQAPHVLLSPFVTLFGLFRAELSPSISNGAVAWWPRPLGTIAWWHGPLLQSIIGLVSLAVAAQVVFGRHTAPEKTPATDRRDLLDRVLDALLWPFQAVWNVLRGIFDFIARLFAGVKSWLLRGNEAIIRRMEKLDNPVLTAEVRRKARRSNWCLHWVLAIAVEAMIFLSLAVPWLVIDFLAWRRIPGDWGQMVVYSTLVVAYGLAGLSVTDGGQAFDRDRANGTLVFLFLTPLHDRAIITGKALAEFAYAAPLLLTAVPWLLIGLMTAIATGDFYVLLVCGLGILIVASTLIFAVYLQTLFAVRARKPGEGAAKALLCGLVVEGSFFALVASLASRSSAEMFPNLAAALILLHCILAFGAWRWALASMRKQRYGDVTASGKTVG
ncbi:MAG TPA: hypothetical protein VF600_03055 [Abditibacteriaceae bacterium]